MELLGKMIPLFYLLFGILSSDGFKQLHEIFRSKLRRLEYSTLEDLLRDLFLIYYNCLTYNDPGSVYGREASRQREALLKRLKALRIPQDTLDLCTAYAVDPC